jgi:hypothetical protein
MRKRLKRQSHHPGQYLPIHPASPLESSAPTLFFFEGQELKRNSWVNIGQSYTCPKAWLEKTWDSNWAHPRSCKKIRPDSLKELAVYAQKLNFAPNVYDQLLQYCVARNHLATRAVTSVQTTVSPSRIEFGHKIEAVIESRCPFVPDETTVLLPRPNVDPITELTPARKKRRNVELRFACIGVVLVLGSAVAWLLATKGTKLPLRLYGNRNL